MFLAAAAVVALASCNNASPKMDEQPAAAAAGESTGNVKIAYVEVDSLMTQYEFCKEFTLILQKKSTNARNTLNQKGQALQNAAPCRTQPLTSSRSCRTMVSPVVSRPRVSRQPSSASSRVCRSCRLVWRTSWPTRLTSTTKVCATHCSTSWQHIIRIRSMTSSSPSRVTTSCMLPSASTLPTTSSMV